MSLIMFFASDKPFEIYEGIKMVNKKNQNIKMQKKLEEANVSILTKEMAMSDSFFVFKMDGNFDDAMRYTKKKYCADIEWRYNDKDATLAISYIQQCMKETKELELWSIWQNEKREAQKKTIRLKDIKIEDIKEIWGQTWYTNPVCYTIKKY